MKNNNKENILNSVFDEACNLAATKMGENISLDEDIIIPEIDSLKLYSNATNTSPLKKLAKFSKYAASVVLALLIVLGISISSVDAWRSDFMQFFYKKDNINTDISFGKYPYSYSSKNITLNYIPENFEYVDFERNDRFFLVLFKKGNESFTFKLTKLDKSTAKFKGKTIDINGMEAIFNEKENILVWNDKKYEYTITGTISQSSMIKIAENAVNPKL